MGSKVEYVESSHMYATNYVRNSKAIGVLWGIFTICYAIISVVAFVTPEWIGDTIQSENHGRFGLWANCKFTSVSDLSGGGETCVGAIDDISSISSTAFKAATIFVGISVILALLAICAMLLFFFCQSTTVYHVCGWIQTFSAVCLIVGVSCYPAGWDSDAVRNTCGPRANRYELGECGIRWAYILAVIGCLDAIILATLAFILATRHVRLLAEPTYAGNGSLYKGAYGEVNNGYVNDAQSIAGSRKSLNMHPVMLMQPGGDQDRFSEFSNRTGRSKHSNYRADYSSSMQNFQL